MDALSDSPASEFGQPDGQQLTQPYRGLLEDELLTATTRVRELEVALQTNRRIGAAIGVLMYRHKITYEKAFELLKVASQRSQRKLRAIAEEVLERGMLEED